VRINGLAAALSILFAHGVATAAPKPSPPMTPTGPWNVEFADSMCLLSRSYGKGGATNLIFKPAMLGNDLEIIVTRATTNLRDSEQGKVLLSIEGKPSPAETYFLAYSTKKQRLLRIWNKEDKFALATVRGTLQIEAKSEARYSFAVPGIDQAFPVLSKCLEQLRTAYKISEADLAAIATKPEANLPSFFSTDDYPYEAWSNGVMGTVGALIWIEANGHVSTCEVVESSAGAILEKTTCNILTKRARFTPARDASGRAIRAPTFTRIRWELPSW